MDVVSTCGEVVESTPSGVDESPWISLFHANPKTTADGLKRHVSYVNSPTCVILYHHTREQFVGKEKRTASYFQWGLSKAEYGDFRWYKNSRPATIKMLQRTECQALFSAEKDHRVCAFLCVRGTDPTTCCYIEHEYHVVTKRHGLDLVLPKVIFTMIEVYDKTHRSTASNAVNAVNTPTLTHMIPPKKAIPPTLPTPKVETPSQETVVAPTTFAEESVGDMEVLACCSSRSKRNGFGLLSRPPRKLARNK